METSTKAGNLSQQNKQMKISNIKIENGDVENKQVKILFKDADDYFATLYPEESNHPAFSNDFIANKSYFLVAKEDQNIVACGGIIVKSDNWGEVKRMYVIPEYRRKGLASKILEYIIDWSTQNQLQYLKLETGIYQPEAINLYLKYNFYEIDPFEGYDFDPNSVFYEIKLR